MDSRDGIFTVVRPTGDALPLVFDSPHSGVVAPPDFQPAVSREQWHQCVDQFVHDLFSAAPEHGAPLLAAEFPRVYIDPNRAEDDIDPAQTPGWTGPADPGEKTRLGKGLVWRTVKPKATPLYDREITAADVRHRIETYYHPYHAALQALADAAHAAHGTVFHINCHSMQGKSGPMDAEGPGKTRADFVLSDREGETTRRDFLEAARSVLEHQGYRVAINTPFKGAEIVRRHGQPHAERHSIQIEINRALYLMPDGLTKNPGYPALKANIDALIAALATFVRENALPAPVRIA